MSLGRLGTGALLLVGAVGCALGPGYQRPEMHVPAVWSETPQNGVTAQPQ
jgi:hypothetical protein